MSATATRRQDRTMTIRRHAGLLFVTIKVKGEKPATYTVAPIPGSPALSYTFAKHGTGDIYDVHCEPTEGYKQCDCKGFLHYGRCRHADCLEALFTCGKLS